jgi:hypothetical protein
MVAVYCKRINPPAGLVDGRMPWIAGRPHRFPPRRGRLSDIAGKWGFNTIPAWMLIGRDGRMVADRNTPLTVTIPRELARPIPLGP